MAAEQGKNREGDDGFALDLLRSIRCGLVITDHSASIRFINEQACKILDLDPERVRPGMRVSEALEAHPHLAQLLIQARRMSTLPDRAEAEIRTRDRLGRTIGYTLSQVCSEDGSPRGAALFFKDLTPIEHQEAQNRLRERLAELGAMAASLAHEIRNPLAALELSTTLLRRRLDEGGPEAKLATTIQEQIRRLSATVNHSLEFIRPLDLVMDPTNITDLINAALEEALPADTGKITIVRRFPPEPVVLAADPTRLRQAFVNLARNAVEAMEKSGGVLAVDVQPLMDACWIRFSDTGPGIPDDIRDRIFAPFFSTKPKGSGLGLAWSRKVLDAHGGLLDVACKPGQGTVFSIRLPAAISVSDDLPTGESLHEAQDSSCRG